MKKRHSILAVVLALLAAASVILIPLTRKKPAAAPLPTPRPLAAAPTETPEAPTYTFNLALNTFPSNWNPHRCTTAADAELLGWLSAGLYAFALNKTGDGFQMEACMAADMPVDVTAELAGTYGLREGETRRAYAIPLRTDLCWDDGSPITAKDFVESARRLLDPWADNPQVGMLSVGSLELAGAAHYLNQAQPIHVENAMNGRYTMEDLSLNEEGVYCTPDGQTVSLALDYPLEYLLYGDTLRFYVETYGDKCFDLRSWESLLRRMDRDGLVPLTEVSYLLFEGLVTGNPLWGDTDETIPENFVYHAPAPGVSWDEVGIFARSDYELVLVLANPLSGFDLLYALTDCWLVNTELYDACAFEVKGQYMNNYGTSAETTASCGPYTLTSFDPDSVYYLRRNPRYFGLTSEEDRPVYQATDIVAEYLPDGGERLERFMTGQLDCCILGEEGREYFLNAPCCRGIPGDTSYLMVFNPDFDALVRQQEAAGEKINKTILTLPVFRQAMSLALDREAFCEALSPANCPTLTLFTPLIIADPTSGIPYRDTEQGRSVIPADVADKNGCDPEKARELINQAWQQMLDDGLVNAGDRVEICVGLPSNSEYYTEGYRLLTRQFTEAAKGTMLEGRLLFTCAEDLGSNCFDALRENRVDMLFGVGWVGRALDPHGLMEAYLSDDYRYDPAWDVSSVRLTVPIHGENCTASLTDWYDIMCGETRSVTGPDGASMDYSCGVDGNPGARLDILAALEAAVLENYDVIPMSEGRTSQLWGRQVVNALDTYVFGLGFGGVKYLTFAYSDREWAEYVAESGGAIDYR